MIKQILLLIFMCFVISSLRAETREKIAVIDSGSSITQSKSGILCESGIVNYTRGTRYDTNDHGTNIIGIIAKTLNKKTQCIISYKVYNARISGQEVTDNITKALKSAIRRGVKFINLSMGGSSSSEPELKAIKKANKKGIYVLVASGNEGVDFDKEDCDYFPACYRVSYKHSKFRVVTTISLKGSNRGSIVTNKERGYEVEGGGVVRSGTSQATAVYTSKLIKK